MSWAKYAKEALQRGETVVIRPRGNSMKPRVNDGDTVTLAPASEYAVNDVVLVHVSGRDYLHLIKSVRSGQFLIGNNRGGTNGWVGATAIFGKAIDIRSRS